MKFANPSNFQKFSEKIFPFCNLITIIFLIIGLYFSFFKSPPDYLQGETVRIMYIHVPCAWLSLMIYSIMAICSFICGGCHIGTISSCRSLNEGLYHSTVPNASTIVTTPQHCCRTSKVVRRSSIFFEAPRRGEEHPVVV